MSGEAACPFPEGLTSDQVRLYDGSDPSKPLLIVVDGVVFDVSAGRGFYGPGGPYALFAGRDVTVCLGKSSVSPDLLDRKIAQPDGPQGPDAIVLTQEENATLEQWKSRLSVKYPKIRLLDSISAVL